MVDKKPQVAKLQVERDSYENEGDKVYGYASMGMTIFGVEKLPMSKKAWDDHIVAFAEFMRKRGLEIAGAKVNYLGQTTMKEHQEYLEELEKKAKEAAQPIRQDMPKNETGLILPPHMKK